MSYEVRVSRRAARQVRTVASWWLVHREKAPLAFATDLEDAFQLAAELPRAAEPVHHPTIRELRRLLLSRTSHLLYYTVDDSSRTVDVLALWHSSRAAGPPLTER